MNTTSISDSSDSGNKLASLASRFRLTVEPKSDEVLIVKINEAVFGKRNQELSNAPQFNAEEFKNAPINKPFKIHLRNGVVESLTVDNSMSKYEINLLKVIVSQFQADTKAKNAIQSRQNQLPASDRNHAFYKTMESTASGQCETYYDISPIPEYLVKSHPEWIPLPNLKGSGEFIQIVKTRNYTSCRGRNSNYLLNLAFTSNNMNHYEAQNMGVRIEETRRMVVSGSPQQYTIQSSFAVGKVMKSQYGTPLVSEYVNITLESVDSTAGRRPQSESDMKSENVKSIDNLNYNFQVKMEVEPQQPAQPPRNLLTSNGPEIRYTPTCWTWFMWCKSACASDFGDEWVCAGSDIYHNCGVMGLGVHYGSMKGVLFLLTAALVGFVTGDGAWEANKIYSYRIQMNTTRNLDSPDSGHKLAFLASRFRLTVEPQSDEVLIAKITEAVFGKRNQELSNGPQFNAEEFKNAPINKPFKIHLRNGVVESLTVDNSMSKYEINLLKVIVSQFQADTKAKNAIQSRQNQLPASDRNHAFYKTMESTAAGQCETYYDISPIPEYLVKSHPEWIPLPNLKGSGEFIQIVKTRNYTSCRGRNSNYLLNLAFTSNDMNHYEAQNMGVRIEETRRMVVSGSPQQYTIQSSFAVGKVMKSQYGTPLVSEYVNITLESVDSTAGRRPQSESNNKFENVKYIDNLNYNFHVKMEVEPQPPRNLITASDNDDAQFTPTCWTWFMPCKNACESEFGSDWICAGAKRFQKCGILSLGVHYACRLKVTSK
ncbi:Vitellogenin [Pseudolycoriella hygida]|uniref:Vitellogenin n=1 Tax=Pseudolycoriella hygida TaxID=35572 RepID=A0A9Q0N9H5_9DIPT|nr:Vitellogenin [Pseudolycoriella hygida]